MNPANVPLWAQWIVGLLLLASALFAVASALGIVRMKTIFQRLHPPALAVTWSAWCVTFASMLYFSLHEEALRLHAWMIIILLSITVPITTVLLSRAALFRGRRRLEGSALPPPLQPLNASSAHETPAHASERNHPPGNSPKTNPRPRQSA